mgnify:CR=1 FL=1
MAFIATTDPSLATGAVLEMYERQQAHWGYVPDYARIFSHRPEALARWGRLLAELRRPVSDYRFELVTLAAALELRHSACSLAHGNALAAMIGNDAVIAIAEGREAEVLSAADTAIVAYARAIIRDARKITWGQVEALRVKHGLSDEEILDIAAIAAAYVLWLPPLFQALSGLGDAARRAGGIPGFGDRSRARVAAHGHWHGEHGILPGPASCGRPARPGHQFRDRRNF